MRFSFQNWRLQAIMMSDRKFVTAGLFFSITKKIYPLTPDSDSVYHLQYYINMIGLVRFNQGFPETLPGIHPIARANIWLLHSQHKERSTTYQVRNCTLQEDTNGNSAGR